MKFFKNEPSMVEVSVPAVKLKKNDFLFIQKFKKI